MSKDTSGLDPARLGSPSRVLLVEDDDAAAETLLAMLERNREMSLEVTRVASLQETFDFLERVERPPHLILLDLYLQDESGVRTLRRLQDHARHSAVVALTSVSEPNVALQVIDMGAQEYLVKEDLNGVVLIKSVRYALERWRLQQALAETQDTAARERELRQLERLASDPRGGVAADMFGQGRLSQRQPARFQEARDEYDRLLAQAMRERAYRTSEHASSDLRSLASVLGFLNAGPRDVVDLHAAAMQHRFDTTDPGAHQSLVEEGRIRVLELMGYLVSYYRARAIVASREARPTSTEDRERSEDGSG